MMKKLGLLPIVLALLVAFSACSNRRVQFRIGVSQCSNDEWRSQMNREILREAHFYDNVEVIVRSAEDDSERQAEDIRCLVEEGVDLLIVAPNEAAPITPVVEEVYAKGIPVVVVDRKILSDKYTAYVSADNYEMGRAVGRYLAEMLDGQGNVIEITGLSGSTPAADRHQGFVSILSDYPDIRLLACEDGAWLRERAEELTDTLLARFPQVDAIYAQNDRMADGAYRAASRRGCAEKMRFIGTDALPDKGCGLEMVLSGELDATCIYPTGGDRVLQIAMDILNGRDYPRETLLTTSIIDSGNAPIMQMQTAHIASLDRKIETLGGMINTFLARYSTQKVVLSGSLLVLLLVICLLVAVYISLRTKSRLNRELSQQKEKLEKQKDQLEKQKNQLEKQKNQLEKQKNQLEEQKDQLEEQKDQLERLSHELESATHAKLVFFTNISHDFRTPLTLIADPIDRLLDNPSIDAQGRQLLELMKKNAHILLRLVNQILDFRKVENGRMEMHLTPFNLLEALEEWNASFRVALLKKHIAFRFDAAPGEEYSLSADAEKMERIYFNLFSNAVKYTPENGHIDVRLEATEERFRLSFFNSGSYIDPGQVESIFQRFYQVDSHQAGTGIGLALVRAFVEMHGGNITAGSDSEGTTFTVDLPRTSVAPASATTDGAASSSSLPPAEPEEGEILLDTELSTDDEPTDADAPTVLVVDDNADIRTYVRSLLSKDYRVLAAADGASGLRLAMKHVPDVIVCDVMMPGMDGMECCRRLKAEMQTSHIPVILLTACSLDEQRIQGYDGGADSYISKPFQSRLLQSRIRNLIENRCRLRRFFNDGDEHMLEKEPVSGLDKDFVSRFRALVEERMQDTALNVEDLGREMGMSRVQLYRKLKSLTNYSPNELLRHMRLRRASSLLASSELTVAEIAYEVGFSSPSYFTKCYKEEFKESPTDFLKRKNG